MIQTKQSNTRRLLAALTCLMLLLSLAACKAKPAAGGLWKDALYTADTTLGSGATVLTAEVEAEDKTVRFTVKTDAATVGEALLSAGLLEGEAGPYGLYIKKVNGMLADYDVDQTYWAFYINDDYATSSADLTPIADGEIYRFVYSK